MKTKIIVEVVEVVKVILVITEIAVKVLTVVVEIPAEDELVFSNYTMKLG